MNKALMTAVAVAVLAGGAIAGPANLGQIPADAKWAAHIDMDAVTASSFAKGVIELIQADAQTIGQDKADKAVNIWTKMQQVQGVTVMGFGLSRTGVMVANLKQYNAEEVLKIAGVDPSNPGEKYGNLTIYSFAPRRGPDQEAWLCLVSDKVIVGGNDLLRVKQVLDLLLGKGEAMSATHPVGALLNPSPGSFVVAAGQNPKPAAADEQAPDLGMQGILRRAQSGRIEMGQNGENLFGSIMVALGTEADAKSLVQIAEGALAMIRLQAQNDPQMAQLAEAIKIAADGKVISGAVAWPAADVLAKMKAKAAAMAERKANVNN